MARKLKNIVAPIVPVKEEPIVPAAAIEYTLAQFRKEIDRFNERKEKFLEDAKTNISYAIEWSDSLLASDYSAGKLRGIISAFEEQATGNWVEDLALLKKFVDHVRGENHKDLVNDRFRGNSTSDSHNTVQHNHRAGAAHLEDVFESVSYWISDAEKGLKITSEVK